MIRIPAKTQLDSTGLQRSVRAEIFAIAIPVALQAFAETLMFAVDTKMVGIYSESSSAARVGAPLATLAVTGPIAWSLTVIFSVTSIGATAVVARRTGADEPERARRALRASAFLALLLGGTLALLGTLTADRLSETYAWIAEDPDPWLQSSVARYLVVYFAFFPIRAVAITLAGALRGKGDARTPFIAGIVGNVGNVIGNTLFIFGLAGCPELGAAGAAVGLGFGSAFELIVFAVKSRIDRRGVDVPTGTLQELVADGRQIVAVSAPAFLDAILFHAGFITYQAAIIRLPVAEAAAHRVAITVQSLAFLSATAFAASGASIAGRMLGAGNVAGARSAAWLNAGFGFAAMLPITALFLLAGDPLCVFFSDRTEISGIAAGCLMIGAFEVPFLAMTEALRGSLRGAGQTRRPIVITVIGTWLVRVPGAWYLGVTCGWGLQGVWTATLLDWIVRALFLTVLVRRGEWATPGADVNET